MLMSLRRFIGGTVILAVCLAAIPTSADMQLYTVTDLGALPGTTMGFTTYISVSDINEAGDIVGWNVRRAGLWTRGVAPVRLHEWRDAPDNGQIGMRVRHQRFGSGDWVRVLRRQRDARRL